MGLRLELNRESLYVVEVVVAVRTSKPTFVAPQPGGD